MKARAVVLDRYNEQVYVVNYTHLSDNDHREAIMVTLSAHGIVTFPDKIEYMLVKGNRIDCNSCARDRAQHGAI
jgi:hypothetical protein